jgi:hypothetical protein
MVKIRVFDQFPPCSFLVDDWQRDTNDRFQMTSAQNEVDDRRVVEDIPYKPGTFRYQDLPTEQRKKFFDDRQRELNPCLKVRCWTGSSDELIRSVQ